MSQRITVTALWTGSQPADYQGDLWEGTIEFEELDAHGEWVAWPTVSVLTVREWVRNATGFVDDDDQSDWFVPRLKHLAPTRDEPHVYEYRVQRPWDD